MVSVIVLTKDEARHIGACLDSLAWADERIVLDSFSTDRTVEIARQRGATVHQRPFVNYADQRNAALQFASYDWVFFVDADERATPELAAEVRLKVEGCKLKVGSWKLEVGETSNLQPPTSNLQAVGFWVPRKNIIFGRWIRHAGWYPDYQLRLMRRDRAHYDPAREVHELVVLDGPAGHLEHVLVHFNYDTLAQFRRKQQDYTRYDARILFQQGVRARPHNFVLQPLREFRRRYITLQGYKDGMVGLQLSLLMAYYEWVKYLKLWRIQNYDE
jgi:glycosyltransferase involved in cell wall biosynthesis